VCGSSSSASRSRSRSAHSSTTRSRRPSGQRRLELIADPAERLRAVVAAAFADRAGGVRDAALLAAATHPLVKPGVERVTQRRLRYMTDAYRQLGLPKPQARRRALILYLSYISVFDYQRLGLADLTDAELGAHAKEILSTLVVPRT
jgi:hypothetical protein